MEFRMLGPIEVRLKDEVSSVTRPQQNIVLAALLSDANRFVSVEALMDRVWEDNPPPHAGRNLQTHIARIRRLLAQDPEDGAPRLERSGNTYRLVVDPDGVDLHRFRRLINEARDQHAGTDRLVLLRDALALWRGEPLAGLPGEWARRMRHGWRQEYLDAAVTWAHAEVDAGSAARLIGPLTTLAGEYPLVESLTAALMRALCAVGRTAEALECYGRTRRILADELGTDPGIELQQMHQAALGRNDAVAPRSAASVAESVRTVPVMLPLDGYGFVGRRNSLACLDAIVDEVSNCPTAVTLIVISGTAGVGKTALAVHWAHQIRARFPDGQLYVNLRGYDPRGSTVEPSDAIQAFLEMLGVPAQRIPSALDQRVGLYRTLLADQRMLIVLDNARDAEQVRPLLPGRPGCLVLVTSRNTLSGLVAAEGARPVHLDLLSPGESRALLAFRLGSQRMDSEPEAVDDIIARCARLPLALAVVAARAAAQPQFSLSTVARDLRDAQDRLDVFGGDDPATDVRTVFSCSYRQLSAAAARLFRLLSIHPGPEISVDVAASLVGTARHQVRTQLAELTQAQLVIEQNPGRFVFHDLLRAYASELAHDVDAPAERAAALHRMLDHYLHTARAATRLLSPRHTTDSFTPARNGVTISDLSNDSEALAWFVIEDSALLAAVHVGADAGLDRHTEQFAFLLRVFLGRRARWEDLTIIQNRARDAARKISDRPAEARIERNLGHTCTRLGKLEDALQHLECALEQFGKLHDDAGQAHTHVNLAQVYERLGRTEQALSHVEQALRLYQIIDHRPGQALALNGLGWYHAQLGNHPQALTFCEQALVLHREVADRAGEAATWDSLGYTQHHQGHYRDACTSFRYALDLRRTLGDRYGEANTLAHLGETHRAAGAQDAARQAWQQALVILDELHHPDAEPTRARLDKLAEASELHPARSI